eukprot:4274333-Prorocentrum_lima.AAC.1
MSRSCAMDTSVTWLCGDGSGHRGTGGATTLGGPSSLSTTSACDGCVAAIMRSSAASLGFAALLQKG